MKNGDTVESVVRALLCMQRFSWEQGVAAQALLELGEVELSTLLAEDAVNRQLPDGRLGVAGDKQTVTDPAANGEPVLHAAARTGRARFRDAADRMLAWLLTTERRTADGTLYHRLDARQVWVDSFYMAPPFLAVAGHEQEAVKQIEGFRRLLRDPAKRLYHHVWDDDLRGFARPALWGVGNGWAAAGVARVIAALKGKDAAARERLIGYQRELLDASLPYMRSDGLFHNNVDDPASFVEVNLSQMLAYSIFRGVAEGYLADDYLGPARRMREAATAKVDSDGLVRDVCGYPGFVHPGTAPEGQAFFLLMEAAARKVG